MNLLLFPDPQFPSLSSKETDIYLVWENSGPPNPVEELHKCLKAQLLGHFEGWLLAGMEAKQWS